MQFLRYHARNLEDFLDRQRPTALLLVTLFAIGVIFGAMAVGSMEVRDRQETVRYLTDTIPMLQSPPEHSAPLLLRKALARNARLLGVLWILGISVVGAPGAMVVTFVRGFISGFVVAFLAAQLGAHGVMLAIAGHLPQSLLEVPALLMASTAAVAFSLQVVRSWRQRRRVRNFYPALASYTGTFLATGLLLVGASLVESYVSPALVRFAVTLFRSL